MPTDLPDDSNRPDHPRADLVATIGQRALARVIDWLVIATVYMAVAVPVAERDGDNVSLPRWAVLTGLAVWLAYETLMVSRLGFTLGKMAVRIRVVDVRDGSLPSAPRAFVRVAAAAAGALLGGQSFGLFVLITLYFSAALDRATYRGLTDRLAGTAVVRSDVIVLAEPDLA